jgi:hypothetical protein
MNGEAANTSFSVSRFLYYNILVAARWRLGLLLLVFWGLLLVLLKIWAPEARACLCLLLLLGKRRRLLELLIILLISFHILFVWRLRAVIHFIIRRISRGQATSSQWLTVFAAESLPQWIILAAWLLSRGERIRSSRWRCCHIIISCCRHGRKIAVWNSAGLITRRDLPDCLRIDIILLCLLKHSKLLLDSPWYHEFIAQGYLLQGSIYQLLVVVCLPSIELQCLILWRKVLVVIVWAALPHFVILIFRS